MPAVTWDARASPSCSLDVRQLLACPPRRGLSPGLGRGVCPTALCQARGGAPRTRPRKEQPGDWLGHVLVLEWSAHGKRGAGEPWRWPRLAAAVERSLGPSGGTAWPSRPQDPVRSLGRSLCSPARRPLPPHSGAYVETAPCDAHSPHSAPRSPVLGVLRLHSTSKRKPAPPLQCLLVTPQRVHCRGGVRRPGAHHDCPVDAGQPPSSASPPRAEAHEQSGCGGRDGLAHGPLLKAALDLPAQKHSW